MTQHRGPSCPCDPNAASTFSSQGPAATAGWPAPLRSWPQVPRSRFLSLPGAAGESAPDVQSPSVHRRKEKPRTASTAPAHLPGQFTPTWTPSTRWLHTPRARAVHRADRTPCQALLPERSHAAARGPALLCDPLAHAGPRAPGELTNGSQHG